jgi:acetyl esterase
VETDMPLDPQARLVLDQLEAVGFPDLSSLDPVAARALAGADPSAPVEEVARVENRSVPGPDGEVPIRIYTPHASGRLPALVYFHGGGWVICSLDTHDGICRRLANAASCIVVSVDYRLAPEHRFPAAPDDCFAATRWVAANASELGADPERIAVGGDSAGGNLAAVVALMARDRGGPSLRHQLLVYPITDRALDSASYSENAEGYLLTRAMMKWFWGHYLPRESERLAPYASPLQAKDLGGLPSAHVITAQYDPLRDEGEAYAARLRDAGVPTKHSAYAGMMHGFFSMGDAIDVAQQAVEEAASQLVRAFER